jgi:hypothetical protein
MQKNTLAVYHSVTDGDMSASITSPVTTITWLDNVAVQLIWTGAPVGTFAVQGCLDYNAATHAPGTWVDIVLSPAPAAAGTASSALVDMNQLSFPYIRVVYTRASGTGTLNVYIAAKEV